MTEKLTLKQAFYRGVQGVFAQGKPSVMVGPTDTKHCLYNAPDGSHCAIGHIPKHPEKLQEDRRYYDDIVHQEIERQTGVPHHGALAELQNAHDLAAVEKTPFIENFMELCAMVAKEHGLTYTG